MLVNDYEGIHVSHTIQKERQTYSGRKRVVESRGKEADGLRGWTVQTGTF